MFKYILIIFLFFSQKIYAENIIGHAKVIDGDTIHIDNKKIRLEGIDAPEIKQKCKKKFFINIIFNRYKFSKRIPCGTRLLRPNYKKIGNSKVSCISSSKDKYKRFLATCFKEKTNINKWLVRSGYAIAYKRYSKRYISEEDYAKKNKLGLWAGSFIPPENGESKINFLYKLRSDSFKKIYTFFFY